MQRIQDNNLDIRNRPRQKKKVMFRFSRPPILNPWFNLTKIVFIPVHVMHIVMHSVSGDFQG